MYLKLSSVFLILALQVNFAYANRITSPADPRIRCENGAGADKCEKRRADGLQNKCITQEEYQTLKDFGSFPTCVPEDGTWILLGWCSCGCFAEDTLISVFEKENQQFKEISASTLAHHRQSYEAVHLTSNSTLSQFEYGNSNIRITTEGLEKQPIVVIETENGRKLRVTEKHPILTQRGSMVQAKDLQIEDGVISQEGIPLKISSLRLESYCGNVINFMVDQPISSHLEHVVFANQIAVGDLGWQSSLEDELNQVMIRQ